MTERVQQAIVALPETAWTPAVDADGRLRAGADVAELTGMLPDLTAAVWPERMRMIVRRERPQSRRPAVLHRHQRLAVPGLRHRHPDRATRRAGGPPPAAMPPSRTASAAANTPGWDASRPDCSRSTPSGSTRPDRLRSDRLDPDHPAARRPRPMRAEDAAIPAAARRRAHHPRRAPGVRPHRRPLALATRTRRRVRTPRRPPAAAQLTGGPTPTTQDPETPATAPARHTRPSPNTTTPRSQTSAQTSTERPGLA